MARARAAKGLRDFAPKKLPKMPAFHAHGCTHCSRRYQDTCSTPEINGRCQPCRTGRPPGLMSEGWAPRPCCQTNSTPADTAEVLVRYALAGPGPWFQCRVCARTHPFDPQEMTV